jgi:D-alanyl-D-alanine carboxypeptidase
MRAVASGFSYGFRVAALGMITVVAAAALTTTGAEAKKRGKSAKASHRAKVVRYIPPYAAIVVDANTGKVLHEANADAPRHPASVTKVMTLYMLFERLEAGKVSLNTELPVSARAAAQAPSKLGLKPGQTLTVDDAIRALVTKSANDAAVVVAEALGETEGNFAAMMTRKARALGMNHTHYRNASGLPNDEQITTARDQALLGRAIQDRFPKQYRYFATASFTYKGRAMRNHNKLLGSMAGIDGIKTGFVNASGFNLLASLKRDNRHLVAVVMGGRTGNARDARMRELLSGHVALASVKRTVPMIAEAPEAGGGMSLRAVAAAVAPTVPAPAAVAVTTQEPAAPAQISVVAALPQPTADAPETTAATAAPQGSAGDIEPIRVKTVKVKASMLPSVAIGQAAAAKAAAQQPVAEVRKVEEAKASPAASAPPVAPASAATIVIAKATAEVPALSNAVARGPGSDWMVQVGALETQKDAADRIASARAKAAKFLGKAKSFTEPIVKADVRLWRARFAGMSKDDAEAACKTLKSAKIVCIALKN